MVGLPDGEKTLRICVTVYTQYRRVTDGRTDRQTDGQTSCHGIGRAMHMRRAVKMNTYFVVITISSVTHAVRECTMLNHSGEQTRITYRNVTSILVYNCE